MKKIVLSLVGILVCATMGFAQGVKFETGTWSDMLAKAKAENKLIFVDVYTQWCGPCKNVAKNVFPQQKMGDVYNKQFINFQIDAESPAGKEFVKQYPVEAYPTFFYINAEGQVINRAVGGKDVDGFLQEAKLVDMYGRYGGIEKMMAAINNGTATEEMYRDYYLSATKKQKPKAINLYLQAMTSEKLMDVNNELIADMSLYDKDLMIRLIDEVIKVGDSEKYATDKKFAQEFDFNIGFPVQFKLTIFLNQSIKDGNWDWFNELLDLKDRLMAYKRSKLDGDWRLIRGRGLFFATPEYCKLCYMTNNRSDEDKFKVDFPSYMEQLMADSPADSTISGQKTIINMIEQQGIQGQLIFFAQNIFELGSVTTNNIIDWTDYFWRISPSDKKTKELCYKYIDYAYYSNPYNIEIALEAADLLARIGNDKDAETILETAIQKRKELKQTDPKVFRPLELKLRDLRNGKL